MINMMLCILLILLTFHCALKVQHSKSSFLFLFLHDECTGNKKLNCHNTEVQLALEMLSNYNYITVLCHTCCQQSEVLRAPHTVCHDYSILPLQNKSSHIQSINEGAWLHSNKNRNLNSIQI